MDGYAAYEILDDLSRVVKHKKTRFVLAGHLNGLFNPPHAVENRLNAELESVAGKIAFEGILEPRPGGKRNGLAPRCAPEAPRARLLRKA